MENLEKICNPYEIMLIERLEKEIGFSYADIRIVDEYPVDVAKAVVKLLVENACQGQNISGIELARNNLKKVRSYLKTQNNCLFLLILAILSRKILEIRQYFSVFSLKLASY